MIAPQPDGGLVDHGPRRRGREDWRPLLSIAAEDALTTEPVAFSADGGSLLAHQLGRRQRRPAGQDRPGHRGHQGAGRGPGGRRDRRPAAPRHQGAAVRHLRERPVALPGRWIRASSPTWPRSARCTRATRRSARRDDADRDLAGRLHQRHRPGAVLRLRPADPPGPVPVRAPARAVALRAGADGAVRVHRPRRPDRPRLRDVPARRRAASGLPMVLNVHGGPWARDVVGLRPRGAVARQPRLPVHAGQLPRLDRLRQGVRQRRRPRVGREDAGRPAGRGGVRGRPGLGRPGPGGHLRRLLRRVRGPGGRRVHPGRCSAARWTSSARRT